METPRLKTEFCVLKCYQTFHIILLILIILCHLITHSKYLLLYKSLIISFAIGIALYIFIFFYILISNIIIFSKKYSATLLYNLYINIKFIAVICVLKGIILSCVYWINLPNYTSFIKSCPFNFTPKQITDLITIAKPSKIKEACQLKRCFFIKEYIDNNYDKSIKKYDYLCNFNYENSYSKYNNNDLDCSYTSYNENINDDEDSNKLLYLKKCDEFMNYYVCTSKKKLHDKFNIKAGLKCPTKFKKYRIIILGILLSLIDIVADLMVILFIYCQYNLIIKLINVENIFGRRYTSSSLNSTKDCSVIINNNYNMSILPQINTAQTEIYISPNLLKNNDNEIIQDKNIKNLIDERNRSELSDSKNELMN